MNLIGYFDLQLAENPTTSGLNMENVFISGGKTDPRKSLNLVAQ